MNIHVIYDMNFDVVLDNVRTKLVERPPPLKKLNKLEA